MENIFKRIEEKKLVSHIEGQNTGKDILNTTDV